MCACVREKDEDCAKLEGIVVHFEGMVQLGSSVHARDGDEQSTHPENYFVLFQRLVEQKGTLWSMPLRMRHAESYCSEEMYGMGVELVGWEER